MSWIKTTSWCKLTITQKLRSTIARWLQTLIHSRPQSHMKIHPWLRNSLLKHSFLSTSSEQTIVAIEVRLKLMLLFSITQPVWNQLRTPTVLRTTNPNHLLKDKAAFMVKKIKILTLELSSKFLHRSLVKLHRLPQTRTWPRTLKTKTWREWGRKS